MEKPIRVFYSDLSGRFYATNHYKDRGNGLFEVTGKKYDVTQDIASIIKDRGIKFYVDKRKPTYRARNGSARK